MNLPEPDKHRRPSEIMRARRPELFSDSTSAKNLHISREVFEFQLESLTNRKQEVDFENFCRRLSEKELCPNLLPQTGPTGGGDSKVDTETYPVAEQIAERWYDGNAVAAAKERWAFAFSTKRDWRAKVQSDVEKIAGTDREYRLIYFITSHYVKDKSRAELEETLSKKCGIPVKILDRSWIMKCVFENDRLGLAIESLHLSAEGGRPTKTPGPLDTERESELHELELQIEDQDRYRGVEYQLAEDCLRAALLARALARPRSEIDGRFERASRTADKVGNQQQRLRVAYNKAWTAYWWFDDIASFVTVYENVEQLALPSNQAEDLELLTNLWMLLNTTVKRGHLDASKAKLADRTSALRTSLTGLATDQTRPNNMLWAKTSLILMDLQEAAHDRVKVEPVFVELRNVVAASKGLISYRMQSVIDIVQDLGKFFTDSPSYDELLEDVISVAQKRGSESEAGELLLKRGFQMLESEKPYDAIRFFGRAQVKLVLRESRGELIAALAGSGQAYGTVGLLWAARAKMIAAANQALSEFSERGAVVPQALVCLRRLVWLELQLGRVSYAMRWLSVASTVASHLGLTEERKKLFIEERGDQDKVMGSLILKTPLEDLKQLGFLPDVFEKEGLIFSWMSLLYALGYEEKLVSEKAIPETLSERERLQFFLDWRDHPASEEMAGRPEYLLKERVLLRSWVIGCEIIVEADNNLHSICVGETILGTLEALLATSLVDDVFAHRQDFKITLLATSVEMSEPKVEFVDKDSYASAIVHYNEKSSRSEIKHSEWILTLAIGVIGRIAIIRHLDTYASRVFGDEAAINRAVNFSETQVPIRNILGETPAVGTLDWKPSEAHHDYPLLRRVAWDTGHQKISSPRVPSKPGKGEPPTGLLDSSKLKHTDRRVDSLINIPLWDRAKWSGVGYLWSPPGEPSAIVLLFQDGGAGRAIFEEWRKSFSETGSSERLRISIISGAQKQKPFSYRMVIGTDFSKDNDDSKQTLVVSRIQQMHPADSKNIDNLRKAFETEGAYLILPARFTEDMPRPEIFLDLSIPMRAISLRNAWQIGENDPDIMALQLDDDPIIPETEKDPPVLRALRQIRTFKL